MPILGYGILAILLLGGANWWQWSHGRGLLERAESAEQLAGQERADADAAVKAAQASSVQQELLAAKLNALRSNYEKHARDLNRFPDDGCLDRALPPGAAAGLRDGADATPSAAAAPDAGAAPGAGLGGPHVPRPSRLQPSIARECPRVGSGQGSGPNRAHCT